MKRKVVKLFVVTLILSLVLVGCKNNEENNNNMKDNLSDFMGGSSKTLSSKETDQIVEALIKITAEKFSITEEAYLESLEKSGKTPEEEFKIAANVMGISLNDYYEYEKIAVANMSDEAKANNLSMSNALSEIAGMDIEAETADAQSAADDFLNAMTSSGGDRIVEGNIKELCYFKVDEVIDEDEDMTYGTYSLEYNSNADFNELYEYFKALLEDTPGSMIVKVPGIEGASMVGTINGEMVSVYIDNEDGDDIINVMVENYK